MYLGGCHGNYNNTGVQNSSKFMLLFGWGAYVLGMDWVDFYFKKWLKIHVILGILRVITTFGWE